MEKFLIFLLISSIINILSKANKDIIFKSKRFLINQVMTTEANRQFCQTHEMTLAYIRDESENTFIKTNTDGSIRLGAIWNHIKNEFEWGDGTEMNYTNWYSSSKCSSSPCCSVYMDSYGRWQIAECNAQLNALCEQIIINPFISLKEEILTLINDSFIHTFEKKMTSMEFEKFNQENLNLWNEVGSGMKKELDEMRNTSISKLSNIIVLLKSVQNRLQIHVFVITTLSILIFIAYIGYKYHHIIKHHIYNMFLYISRPRVSNRENPTEEFQ